MAEFHGDRGVHIGFPVWAKSVWYPDLKKYVVSVTGADLKKFRALAEQYGFAEVKGSGSSGDSGE